MKKLFFFGIPLSVCNLRCHYCYLSQRDSQYEGIIPTMEYDPDQVAYAMRMERVGGPSFFNLCADGETLLLPNIEEYVRKLALEGHWIEIVSNMTITKKLDQILNLEKDVLSHIEFKCSLHYLQLKERGILDKFSRNINAARQAGASITVEITPTDELIPYIEEVKEYCISNFGALPHLTIARDDATSGIEMLTNLSIEKYNAIWSTFDSSFWRFKSSIFGVRQTGFCNAGAWSYMVDMPTGNARQCYCGVSVGNIFADPDKPLPEKPIGRCLLPHCYNGHALLTLGTIADLTPVCYGDIRDRKCTDGTHWLQPELKAAFNTKLQDSNKLPSSITQQMDILKTNIYDKVKMLKNNHS